MYSEKLLEQIQLQIEDESLFPRDENQDFPRKFDSIVKSNFRRMARIYGHLFYSHYDLFKSNQIDVLLNSSFKHFMFFVLEFSLISKRDLQPYEELISKMRLE